MNRWAKLITIVGCALSSWSAVADVSLTNRDGKSHDITIKCSSTTQTSIGSNVTRGIGRGPCTVTVKSTGASGSGTGDDKLVIKNGSVARQ